MSDRNQCDGCQAGRPVDKSGNHRMGDGEYGDLMRCQRYIYEAPSIPPASDRPDGSVVLPGVPWQELARRYEVALRRIVDTDTHGKNVRDEHGTMRPTGTDFCGRCNRNSYWPHADDCPIKAAIDMLDPAPSATTAETAKETATNDEGKDR